MFVKDNIFHVVINLLNVTNINLFYVLIHAKVGYYYVKNLTAEV